MAKSRLSMNEMIGYVDNDKHPKTVRVSCDRYMYVVRYKKSFRYSKHVRSDVCREYRYRIYRLLFSELKAEIVGYFCACSLS